MKYIRLDLETKFLFSPHPQKGVEKCQGSIFGDFFMIDKVIHSYVGLFCLTHWNECLGCIRKADKGLSFLGR